MRAAALAVGLAVGPAITLGVALAVTAPSARAQEPDWSLRARQRVMGLAAGADGNPAASDERRALLDAGEGALARGDVVSAQAAFDRAALMLHAPDTEAGLVRTQMQAGDYRQALAFGAHAAGAHLRQWPAGMALYAWLLHAGGQDRVARRMLSDALEIAPGEPALLAAQAQLAQAWPRADGLLRGTPLRLAPRAWGAAASAGARVVATGVLVDGGRSALVPAAALGATAEPSAASTASPGGGPGATATLWLRNGLGQTVRAWRDGSAEAYGLVALRLDPPLPAPTWTAAPRPPFGGSPAALVEYAADDGTVGQDDSTSTTIATTAANASTPDNAAWPLLHQGFIGRLPARPGPRPLGLAVPAGPRGGPLIDAQGRLAGIALREADGRDTLLDLALLRPAFAALLPAADDGAAAPAADLDRVYERALPATLQVLVAR